MKPENELALIVGYFLSRLDKEGYMSLGYETFLQAVTDIGSILGVKKNTVKNMRDEFDPYHQNTRVGWKRPLSPSRQKILAAFEGTDDETLTEIVKEILENQSFNLTEGYSDIHLLFSERKKSKKNLGYVARSLTGKAAENHFIAFYRKESKPINGKLKDCRDLGCGYDFEICTENKCYYIEVKGLSGVGGGIVFTNKEWRMAKKYGDNYYLALIKNVSENPEVSFIINPYSKLHPSENIYATLQVSWGVRAKDLKLID